MNTNTTTKKMTKSEFETFLRDIGWESGDPHWTNPDCGWDTLKIDNLTGFVYYWEYSNGVVIFQISDYASAAAYVLRRTPRAVAAMKLASDLSE